jgi:enterochelin esterase-like enzyme
VGSVSKGAAGAGDLHPRRVRGARRRHVARVLAVMVAMALIVCAVSVGVLGAVQYGVTFWRYRGFPAPTAPAQVEVPVPGGHEYVKVLPATVEEISLRAPSLGGWSAPVDVILPPEYAEMPWVRYPVLYLLHGTPGEPSNFLQAGDLLPTYEVLLAEGLVQPMIIVLPSGAKSYFADSEWANGVLPGSGWETFVSGTLVTAIDSRFRTIADGASRGIGGLSEGGYGALNIGFHHPAEFSLIESWSGYAEADDIPSIFGQTTAALRENSPVDEARALAPTLLADGVFVWQYIGSDDVLLRDNEHFSDVLTAAGIAHSFLTVGGGAHTWALWREMMAKALVVASEHLNHG